MTFLRKLLSTLLPIACVAFMSSALASDCGAPTVKPHQMVQQVMVLLQQAQSTRGLLLELEPLGELPGMTAPSVELLSHGLRSRVAVKLKGQVCGRMQVTTVWFKLRAFQKVWVYGRDSKAGNAVDSAQLRREQIDLAGAQLAVEDLAGDPQGLWLAQNVRTGMPVLNRHLQPEPLVKRHEVLRVMVRSPGLTVSTQGKAMRPGMLGERVPVLLDGVDSSLLAIITGPGEVHIDQP